MLLVGVVGALAGAREYGSRMISVTIAAVPRRWQVVVAKAVVLTGVVLPTALIGVLAAFGVGMGILSAGDGATVALTDDGVLRSVLGMAGYLTAIALIGLGLGILLRSAASSIGVLIAGVMVLPALAGALLPASVDSVLQFLPSSAAAAFTTVRGAGDTILGPTAGALVLAAWVAVTLGASVAGDHPSRRLRHTPCSTTRQPTRAPSPSSRTHPLRWRLTGRRPQRDHHPVGPGRTDPFVLLSEDWFSTTGFEWHPHRGLETVTFVLDGVLEHGDNVGNLGTLNPAMCSG